MSTDTETTTETAPAEKAAPRSLLERRKQATITSLLKRRMAAMKFINTAEEKHAQKVAPYKSELDSVAEALKAQGSMNDDEATYYDTMCETTACLGVPVGSFGDDGVYLCQACVDSSIKEQQAAAPGGDLTDTDKLNHAYTRGA